MKQDYPKIRRAGAELVVICPESAEKHRQYGLALFGEELPYPFVRDPDLEIAKRYSLLRKDEHPHGGFYCRSLWILNQEAVITHKSLPWNVNSRIDEHQKMFAFIGSEPGEWRPTKGLGSRDY